MHIISKPQDKNPVQCEQFAQTICPEKLSPQLAMRGGVVNSQVYPNNLPRFFEKKGSVSFLLLCCEPESRNSRDSVMAGITR